MQKYPKSDIYFILIFDQSFRRVLEFGQILRQIDEKINEIPYCFHRFEAILLII